MIKLNKKDLITRLTHLGSTIECGLHSNIPACCVHYYATKWMWKTTEEKQKRWRRIRKAEKRFGVNYWGYIPCPKCLKKGTRVEKLKRCKCYHAEECAGPTEYITVDYKNLTPSEKKMVDEFRKSRGD